MPGIRADRGLLVFVLLGGCAAAIAQDGDTAETVADRDLLEYLGSWEASDDEWMLFAGDDVPTVRQDEPAPDDDASAEEDNEG